MQRVLRSIRKLQQHNYYITGQAWPGVCQAGHNWSVIMKGIISILLNILISRLHNFTARDIDSDNIYTTDNIYIVSIISALYNELYEIGTRAGYISRPAGIPRIKIEKFDQYETTKLLNSFNNRISKENYILTSNMVPGDYTAEFIAELYQELLQNFNQ